MKKLVFNEKLLRLAQKHLVDNEVRLHYIPIYSSQEEFAEKHFEFAEKNRTTLEAVVCLVSDGVVPVITQVESRASKVLGIEYNNNRIYTEADQLFYPSMFPLEYKDAYESATLDAVRRDVYLRYIDEFVARKLAGTLPVSVPCGASTETKAPVIAEARIAPPSKLPRPIRRLLYLLTGR